MTQLHQSFEIKQFVAAEEDPDNEGSFTAVLAAFNNIDFGGDIILEGAFNKSLHDDNKLAKKFPLLADHDSTMVIGGFFAEEQKEGLIITGQINLDTQAGRENFSNLKKGNKTGFSVGFMLKESDIDEDRGVRLIQEAELFEGSVVTFPMNDKARLIDIKSVVEDIETKRDFEKFLRESGFSKSDATRIASNGYEVQRESEVDEATDYNNAFINTTKELNNG